MNDFTPPTPTPGYQPPWSTQGYTPPQQPVYYQQVVPQKTNGMSIASLVLGIVGLIFGFMYVVPPILATIFGGVAIYKIGRSQVPVGGKGMAIAGLVMGIVGTAFWGIIFLAVIGASS
jgi:hypothetical protein